MYSNDFDKFTSGRKYRLMSDHKDSVKTPAPSELKAAVFTYLVAFWTVGVAFLATLILSPLMQPGVSPLFLLAVMFSAWRKGLRAGLFATFLSVFASAFVFLPPKFSFEIDRNDWLQLIVFSFAAVVIGSLSASRKQAEEEKERSLSEAQNARIEAERANAVKDEFLAVVSHELRTPLTTIKTLTRVMQRRKISEKERSEYLADVASECDRQIDLVHNLLDLTRIKTGGLEIESEFISAEEAIRVCAKLEQIAAKENGQDFSVEIPHDLHHIRADRNALRRALCTITENAIKFTPRGGQIILRAFNKDQYIIIEVEDTGRGISSEDLPYIFDKFYRGRAKDGNIHTSEAPGVGLGLHLARALVEGMSGTIEVESRLDHGSKFTIRLPIWRERSDDRNISPLNFSKDVIENPVN